jgi:cytidine deaminase
LNLGIETMPKEIPTELLRAAVRAARNAYAPYSRFAVGAALETDEGSVFTGANMENASFGLSVCAEVGALQAASTAGKLSEIVRIAVVGGAFDELGQGSGHIITPCGRCRQLILESAHLGKRDIEVWCADMELTVPQCFNISELLPHAIGLANLVTVREFREV